MNDDWANQFKSLLSSPLGGELLRTLKEDVHDNLIDKAQVSDDMENAFGLLKEAGGVIKAIEHLQSIAGLASVPPTDEGGKVK